MIKRLRNRIIDRVMNGHYYIASIYGGADFELRNQTVDNPLSQRDFDRCLKAILTRNFICEHCFYLEESGRDVIGWYIFGIFYILGIN